MIWGDNNCNLGSLFCLINDVLIGMRVKYNILFLILVKVWMEITGGGVVLFGYGGTIILFGTHLLLMIILGNSQHKLPWLYKVPLQFVHSKPINIFPALHDLTHLPSSIYWLIELHFVHLELFVHYKQF